MALIDRILAARGMSPTERAVFLSPHYPHGHDPFLLPDMKQAVDRLVSAHKKQEKITIYGDYDIDGLTATTLLLDALGSFGFTNVKAFIPNRFVEGYGLTVDAIERIAADGADLIITVDCGSLSHVEIARANELGVDVIVTDHHNVAETPPPAVATINPKRPDHDYPFTDLAGVGVAFKLVQALQTKLDGLPIGQEKWLLDLVALGTVCDVVTLIDENRTNVYWGLKVLAQTRRPGLRALMAVASVEPRSLNARSLGFALGPRMNAAGRLETAEYALNLLTSTDGMAALQIARQLDELNKTRRIEQAKIVKEVMQQAEKFADDPVLVVSSKGWNHGIVGIVAAKLLEKYQKPTYVLEEMGDKAKGSARSYGDFSAVDAIRAADDLITKGGGHKLAAGVTLPTENIPAFRERVNQFFKDQKLRDQAQLLLPQADVDAELTELTEELIDAIAMLEPFGHGNPQPILKSTDLLVVDLRKMGDSNQHVKLTFKNEAGETIQMLAFSAPDYFFVEPGEKLNVWYTVDINEWQGRRSVEGRLLHIELT
jgi:single-stranded-DNA-specific exonuclease